MLTFTLNCANHQCISYDCKMKLTFCPKQGHIKQNAPVYKSTICPSAGKTRPTHCVIFQECVVHMLHVYLGKGSPFWSKLLTWATPRSIEIHHPDIILLFIANQAIKIIIIEQQYRRIQCILIRRNRMLYVHGWIIL